MIDRTRRLTRAVLLAAAVLCLLGAAVAGPAFAEHPMDQVLLQMVFYGCWACLLGSYAGGVLGAAIEEDACAELDMGTLSSMGAILGALSAGLLGTAAPGLAFFVPWPALLAGAAAITVGWVALGRFPLGLARAADLDERGLRCDPAGERLPEQRQPWRMRDRVVLMLAVSVVLLLGLTLAMALLMGSDLGHPVMMAPMMYGMFGAMLGGMLGGWLAGLMDEHRGHPDHDNPVMVAAMALMAGMMGGMPGGMIGGMLGVMGLRAIGLAVGAGLLLPALGWLVVIHGRYRLVRSAVVSAPGAAVPVRTRSARTAEDGAGTMWLRVHGMTCDACASKIRRRVEALPGVAAADVELDAGRMQLSWTAGFPGLAAVRAALGELGYEVELP